jgi:formate dehydrogenase gamma subunit
MRIYVSITIVILFLVLLLYLCFVGINGTSAQNQANQPQQAAIAQPEEKNSPAKVSLECRECHGVGKTLPYLGGQVFHKDAHSDYDKSLHASAVNNGAKAATCMDCHSVGGDMTTILPASDLKSTINRANIAVTCGKCHGDNKLMAKSGISNKPFVSYQSSVHANALSHGNLKAAVCSDCHRSHDILPATDSSSSIFKFNTATTCGKCHGEIALEFTQSIHGTSLARGNNMSPSCTNCHGIHSIKPQSASRRNLGLVACSQCHEGVRLSQEFGVAAERVSSFEDSYHGRAMNLGSDVVADCASCHGVHNILPSSNPKSLIHPANLARTCGQCHPGAGVNFAIGEVHLNAPASQDMGSKGQRWVRWIYLFLITVVIGGMVAHNALIWGRKVVAKSKQENRPILRMSVNQRVQHWLLLTSFIVLVISGFALIYPGSWLGWLLGGSEPVRRIVHRIAAVVMLAAGTYHLVYLALTREGRQWLKDMLPRLKDFKDFKQNMVFYLGLSSEKPKFARFKYADKAEYWAVIWGTIIMGLTGLMIWFKIGVFGFLPRWTIDIAIAIHFYEAVLATLAIIVWHFYYVIFDPDVYPINTAFYDGRMSEELFKEEHELAYEEMKQKESAAEEVEEEQNSDEVEKQDETEKAEPDSGDSK